MDHTNEMPAENNVPSGAMVREHWSNWNGFTKMAKAGIVIVGFILLSAVLFITGAVLWGAIVMLLAVGSAAFFAVMR